MSVSDLGKKISGKAKEISQKAKIMSETNSLNNIVKGEECKIDFQYKTIGKLYVEKFGENPDPEFLEAIEAINASNEKIEQTKQEIAKIRSRYNCPECGEAFKNGAVFCSKCGAKLPEIVEEAPAMPENTQKCGKCGNVLKKEAVFCNVCGNKLDEQPAEETALQPSDNEAFAPTTEAKAEETVIEVKEEELKPVAEEVKEEVKADVVVEETVVEEVKTEAAAEEKEAEAAEETAEENVDGKVCPNCGNKMYADDIFCNECGTKVE